MKTLIAILSLIITAAAHAAPPANDSIAKAAKFTGSYTRFENQNLSQATASPGDPLLAGVSAGKTLWYSVPTPRDSSTLILTVESVSGEGTMTVFSVFDGENVAGSLRGGFGKTFTAGATETLNIGVSSAANLMVMLSGEGTFHLTYRLGFANDFPITATTLSGDKGTVSGFTQYATVSADEPVVPDGEPAMRNTVWYKWTPSFTGTAWVDTNFSFINNSGDVLFGQNTPLHNTVLAVFSGASATSLSHFASDEDSGYGPNSRVGFQAQAGETYYIAVGTVPGQTPGYFHLQYYPGGTGGEIYLFGFDAIKGSILEDETTFPIYVRRRYADPAMSAGCNMADLAASTASPGQDFDSFSPNFTFPAGATNASWEQNTSITLHNDAALEAQSEKVVFTLRIPSNATLGSGGELVGNLLIYDDEFLAGQPGGLYFPQKNIRVREGAGQQFLAVLRDGSGGNAQSFFTTAQSGTATEGVDFGNFAGGILVGSSHGNVSFNIGDDFTFEGDETFTASVAGVGEFTVTIEDDDPYVPEPGTLSTVLCYGSGARHAQLIATVAQSGAVTGKVMLLGQSVSFSGRLDLRGEMTALIAPKGRPSLVLSLSARDADGGFRVELLDSAVTFSPRSIENARVQRYKPKTNPCPFAGAFTLAGGDFSTVKTACAAAIAVTPGGMARVTGRAFDGTPFAFAGLVDGNGELCAVAPSFAGKGQLAFSGPLPALVGQVTDIFVSFNRPARAGDLTKLEVTTSTVHSTVARYTPPGKDQYALDAWLGSAGKATLANGPLMGTTILKNLTITPTNAILAAPDAELLKLKLLPKTGIFVGSFIPPGAAKPLPIFGALTDLPALLGTGTGFFFDGKNGGTITLGKP